MKLDPQTGKVNYGGWAKGVDNRRSDDDIDDDSLRDAVNVDVSVSGRVRMRRGITQSLAMAGAHSLFSDGQRMLFATAASLRSMTFPGPLTSLLLTDSRLRNTLSYVSVNGVTYFSNELINGKVNAAGAYEPWGIVPPATQPVCTGSPVGIGTARQYQVSCTFITASGMESGSNLLPVLVICGDPANIVASSIPQSADPRVIATRLYVTNTDGEIFYRDQDVPAGVTSVAMNGFFGRGGPFSSQFMSPPPAGQLVEYLNGIIYIAQGSTLWHTEPLSYDLHTPRKNFISFGSRITMVKAVPDGLFVSADQTYFIEHMGTDDVKRRVVLPHRAIEGAACGVPDSTDVMWFSERGFVRGSAGGAVRLLTDAQISVDVYAKGALSFDENNGQRTIIAALNGPTPGAAATEFTAADAIRRAEIL